MVPPFAKFLVLKAKVPCFHLREKLVIEGFATISLFTQLRRRLANFAGYFPKGSVARVREWIWTWAGFYNLSKLGLC
jgi:hypothetical protein